MADDVVVQFGAQVDALNSGVDEAKKKIESLKESAEQVAEGFSKLAEVAGIAFGVEAIKHFIESMGELGLQTERIMATLGISSEAVGELSGVAKLTGTSMEGMALSIERMSLNIQRSTRDGTNPAAQALKVLGISAKDLIGLPADQYFGKLADAVSKFNPSLNLTNALMQIGGRGVQQMLPELLLGKEHFEELQAAVRETGSVMDEFTTKSLAESHERITLLGLAMQGAGIAVFKEFKPAIDGVVLSLTGLVEWFTNSIDKGGLVGAMFSILSGAAKTLATGLLGVVTGFEELVSLMELAGSLATGEATDAFKKWEDDLDKIATKASAAFKEIWRLHVEITKEGPEKKEAPTIDFGAKGAESAAVEALKVQIQAADAAFALEKDRLADQVKLHEITHTQETNALLRALAIRVSAEETAQNEIKAMYPKGSAEYEKAQAELTKIEEKFTLERQKIQEKERDENVKDWTTALTQIQSAWDSQLKGLLAGTTSWATAMKSIVADLVIDIIKDMEKIAIEKIALGLGGTAIGGGGIGGAIFGALGSLAGFQAGTDYVPQTGLALVHQGEAIIPASMNPAAGGSGGGGGPSINISISAIDGASVQRIAPMLARQITQLLNNNPTMRPAY
jgi:hypothetical protein